MKNIFLFPTENSSRLSYNQNGVLEIHRLQWRQRTQYVYITSDEEIKDGDWVTNGLTIMRANLDGQPTMDDYHPWKKIILTTDQDLIKDGVQAIDDDFLEWFVKNPSCERVEIEEKGCHFDSNNRPIIAPVLFDDYTITNYMIVIPQEEPKQETLEEVAEKYSEENFNRDEIFMRCSKISFIDGFKLAQQQGYSEEEIKQLLEKAEKWDKLSEKISKCYVDKNGDELSEEDSQDIDLVTIGEIAASAFGWL